MKKTYISPAVIIDYVNPSEAVLTVTSLGVNNDDTIDSSDEILVKSLDEDDWDEDW